MLHGPKVNSYPCCNNANAGTVIEFGRGVESGSVTELGVGVLRGRWSRVGEMSSNF